MPVTTFTDEEIQAIAKEVTKQLLPILTEHFNKDSLPPLMTRKQFMEFLNIGGTKCNELFNQDGFPVTRELGHPRVITEKFFEWINESAEGPDNPLRYYQQAN
ncbi:hypothetical protein [Oceanobacillus locisalsi]|uniref:DNA-binding protein n=1 Tax=Oceanobacillus locisalsi TaxID=546107 RepID=A0ABW3NGD8_9BACI